MGDGGPEVFPTSSNVVVHDGRHGEATTPSSSSPSTSDPTPPWTDGGAFNDSWAAGCRLGSPFDDPAGLNPVTLSICTLYLFFGVFGAFFGYRCFKATMFLTGFVFASIIVYLICLESQQEAGLPLWAAALIALSAGLLFGLITLLVQYVGLFILGFHGGLLMGLAGLVVAADLGRRVAGAEHGDPAEVAGVDHHDWTHSPWVSVGCLLASGLTLALCNLYFQKSLTIFCSAVYGGAVVATGLDHLVENSAMLLWIWDKVRVKEPSGADEEYLCWYSWAILGSWPLVVAMGVVSQYLVVGKAIYHEQQFSRTKRTTAHRVGGAGGHHHHPESRQERKERKYRYLYQVRTCHGDVISQPIANKYVHQVDSISSAA